MQPTYAQSASVPGAGSRIRKPDLDEMTVGRTEVPVGSGQKPSRRPDPLAKTPERSAGGSYDKGKRRGRQKKTGRPGM